MSCQFTSSCRASGSMQPPATKWIETVSVSIPAKLCSFSHVSFEWQVAGWVFSWSCNPEHVTFEYSWNIVNHRPTVSSRILMSPWSLPSGISCPELTWTTWFGQAVTSNTAVSHFSRMKVVLLNNHFGFFFSFLLILIHYQLPVTTSVCV